MAFAMAWRALLAFFLSLTCALQVAAQTGASASLQTPPPTSTGTNATSVGSGSPVSLPPATAASNADVYLNVPTLSVGRIELDVDNLSADINLNANVASLVTINAGVQVGITKVNLTIADVDAELELIVRLGNLVDIVNRVFSSLDLNPLLINTLNNVTSVLDDVVGEVDGLLGSITQGGTTLSFVSSRADPAPFPHLHTNFCVLVRLWTTSETLSSRLAVSARSSETMLRT
jgi:hypothetical protein